MYRTKDRTFSSPMMLVTDVRDKILKCVCINIFFPIFDPETGICDNLCIKVGESSPHCTECRGKFLKIKPSEYSGNFVSFSYGH